MAAESTSWRVPPVEAVIARENGTRRLNPATLVNFEHAILLH